jgi:hypothetical protein
MGPNEQDYRLRGGPCDGEVRRLRLIWRDGRWVPPPFVRAIERLPLPVEFGPVAVEAVLERHEYRRVWHREGASDGWWTYEYDTP